MVSFHWKKKHMSWVIKQHRDALNDGYANIRSREQRDFYIEQAINLTQQSSRQW